MTKFRVATADKDKDKDKDKGDDHVDYENYRHVCHKWHYRIAKSLVVCLESKDYVQIRNALTILFKILPSFPVLQQLAAVVEKRIEKVCAMQQLDISSCLLIIDQFCFRFVPRRRTSARTST